jgi:autotransporter-associated beta strand protein
VTVGSLEGDGLVVLGGNALTVGGSNRDMLFSGTIQDGDSGQGGSLTKLGTGKLVLSRKSTYTGTTNVNAGQLLVNSRHGSGTGRSAVLVNGGRLGGTGLITGAVTVGSGSGSGAFLSPGPNKVRVGTLTIQHALSFHPDGTYEFSLNSDMTVADNVLANGVTIDAGAQFAFTSVGTAILPAGTAFTVISNTAVTPIAGTFANLADGSTVVIGSNTYQVSYSGGDGNDLTLTVVP